MKEFYKYFIVGVAAAVLDVGAFTMLAMSGVHYLAANVISTCLGLVFNYYFSCTWVFRQKKINVQRDFLPFVLIGFLGMGLQCMLLYVLIDLRFAVWSTNLIAEPFGQEWVYFSSKVFVAGVTFLWNFFLRKHLVFHRGRKKEIVTETESDILSGDVTMMLP